MRCYHRAKKVATIAWKMSHVILSGRADSLTIDSLSIATENIPITFSKRDVTSKIDELIDYL